MRTDVHWKPIGLKSHHGIAVPLASIHTENSHGIGEFLDLIPLIDFCKKIGFDTIQLLPINDSGYDPSPYNILSSTDLNPVYISLTPLGIYDPELKALTRTKRVEYHKVRERKLFLLRDHSLQEICYAQMKQVRDYATSQGVFIKGDIPILLNAESRDVRENPTLFNQELVAGAPPDMYNSMGQKWDFPLFNWDAMRASKFNWWNKRLVTASSLYHIYRIDHVVGLFRIWAIPKDKKAIDGHFIPLDPNLWENQGREILEMMLNATRMLPIAEDLGTVPPKVRQVLKEYGICGTKVMRWERRWDQNKELIPFNEYEPFSLTTVSTHDSETLQQWWRNHPDEAKLFCSQYEPYLSYDQRFHLLHIAHHTPSYFHINLLQEYLALFPELVSDNPEDERINIPGIVLPTNWTYRFKPNIKELQNHTQLCKVLRRLIS